MSLALVSLTPAQSLGIPVALVGSVFLAVGAELQQHGVTKVGDSTVSPKRSGLSWEQLVGLARRPSWLAGTLMLGLAIVLQLFSLYLAPPGRCEHRHNRSRRSGDSAALGGLCVRCGRRHRRLRRHRALQASAHCGAYGVIRVTLCCMPASP